MATQQNTSTKVPLVHNTMLDGMNQGVPVMLVPPNQWWTQFNFRTRPQGLEQVPRKQVLQDLKTGVAPTAMLTRPIFRGRKADIFVFSDRVHQLTGEKTNSLVALEEEQYPLYSNDTSVRWALAPFEGKVYFTNLATPTKVLTEHPVVRALATSSRAPAAQHIETFFDHLVWGNVDYQGRFPYRVLWSNKGNFADLQIHKASESDYYDFLDQHDSFTDGVTGLKKWGDRLIAYTGNSIWAAEYVGLPTVMRWRPVIQDVGNDFPWSLVAVDRFHFFISEDWKNVAVFDGTDTPQAIGDEIAPYFFDDLTTDLEYRYLVHGYRDGNEREIVWAYVSKASNGLYDKEIVYSLRTKHWYVRSCNNVTAFTQGGLTTCHIDALTGSINNLTGSIAKLGLSTFAERIWASGQGVLLTDYSTGTPQEQVLPYLETGDYTYGNLEYVKELESLCLMASLGTAYGIKVYISVRNNSAEQIIWLPLSQVWTPTLREGRLSPPRVAGRLFRFKFQPEPQKGATGVDNVKWAGFIENVYGAQQVEK